VGTIAVTLGGRMFASAPSPLRDAVFDAANHPYAWLPGQDLSPLRAVASQVLARSGFDPDAPVVHERVISYRVYRKGE